MSQENFWVLLSKKLSGEASGSELKELERLILEHPEWQYAVQNLEELWKQQPPRKESIQEEDAYMLHLHRMQEMNIPFGDEPAIDEPVQSVKRMSKKWYWAAAAILIAGFFGVSRFFFKGNNDKAISAQQLNEISTRRGSKSKIQLPDGSVVWLNAGSKLTYTKDYGRELREVTLTGEGYFDVMKMKETPFIIHTSSIDIKVLGTVFNVKAYPEDKQTETSLLHGSIEVTIKNRPDNKIILRPNDKLVVENELMRKTEPQKTVTVSPAYAVNKIAYTLADSAVIETQWIDNKLVFRDESFAEVAERMKRWYDVNVEITDPKLQEVRMSGNFEKETVGQALEALKIFIPFRHEQTGNKIIIHR